MSVVIVGGNERMVCQYEDICKGFGCKAKVFAKEKGAMKKKIGVPDLMILPVQEPPDGFPPPFLSEVRKDGAHSLRSSCRYRL